MNAVPKMMKRSTLAFLIELSKEKEPHSVLMLRDKNPSFAMANTIFAGPERWGLVKAVGKIGKGTTYLITEKGRKEIKKQLELAPLEEHPAPYIPANRQKEPVIQEAPPAAPNLSVTAETAMTHISAVLEENARLRDVLDKIHKQIGELLHGTISSDTTVSEQDTGAEQSPG